MTNKAKQEMLRMETMAKFPYLIHITRYSLNEQREDLYFANSDTDVIYDGHTYKAGFFVIDPPEKNDAGISNAKITISAVDQEWIVKLRDTQKRATIEFLAVIQYAIPQQPIEPIEVMEFELTNADWTDTTVQWTMVFDEGMDIQIPPQECTSTICAGVA